MMTTIDVRKDFYLSRMQQIIPGILTFFSIFYLIVQIGQGQFSLGSYLIAIVTAVIGITLLTMRKGIEIDLENLHFRQYTWTVGMKKGDFVAFEKVNQISLEEIRGKVIGSARYAATYDIRVIRYQAYIQFDDREPLPLDADEYKPDLLKRIARYQSMFEEKQLFEKL